MAKQLEVYDEKGERVFEGSHEDSPFVDEVFNVQTFQECCTCNKRTITLKDDGIVFTSSSICGSEEKKQFYSSIGTISAKRVCCSYDLKIQGIGTFGGDLCMCSQPCCVTGTELQKLKSKIDERVDHFQSAKGGAAGGGNNTTVVVQQAAPQQPQMMMMQPQMVVQQPMMMQPQPVMVAAQPQPVMVAAQPQMMVAAPQMVQAQ